MYAKCTYVVFYGFALHTCCCTFHVCVVSVSEWRAHPCKDMRNHCTRVRKFMALAGGCASQQSNSSYITCLVSVTIAQGVQYGRRSSPNAQHPCSIIHRGNTGTYCHYQKPQLLRSAVRSSFAVISATAMRNAQYTISSLHEERERGMCVTHETCGHHMYEPRACKDFFD